MKMRQTIKIARYFDKKARDDGESRFDGLSKNLRENLVSDPGELDFKRFLLSSEPKLREKLKALRDVVNKLCIKYPEVIGVTYYGSQVKGYADAQSDIDACIFIDEDKVRLFRGPHQGGDAKLLPRYLEIEDDIESRISDAGLKKEARGITRLLVSKEDIGMRCYHNYFEDIYGLFHLATGKRIYEYREIVFSTLEKMGDRGEEIWRGFMDNLHVYENLHDYENPDDFDPVLAEKAKKRRNLYPKTLAEGRKYFLRNAPKNP